MTTTPCVIVLWYQVDTTLSITIKGETIMFEIAWKEVAKTGRIVYKRKSFTREIAMERFIDKLFQKDNFLEIVASRYWGE